MSVFDELSPSYSTSLQDLADEVVEATESWCGWCGTGHKPDCPLVAVAAAALALEKVVALANVRLDMNPRSRRLVASVGRGVAWYSLSQAEADELAKVLPTSPLAVIVEQQRNQTKAEKP